MPKLIAASVAVAIMAGIAALLAIIENRPPPTPPPPPGPEAVFTLVDDQIPERATSCHSRLMPAPPAIGGSDQTSVTAAVDRAIYECLFVNTRSGILSPEHMPQDRIDESMANLTKATMAKGCREEAALSPREALVSSGAAQQISQRVSLCYAKLPAATWEQLPAPERRQIITSVADLLTAYAYSYHELRQEPALMCRGVYLEAAESRDIVSVGTARQALQIAEASRREYCACVIEHLQVQSDNPLRTRSC